MTPVSGSTWNNRVQASGSIQLADRQRQSYVNYITSDFFATDGTPIVAGRGLTARDTNAGPPVVVVK